MALSGCVDVAKVPPLSFAMPATFTDRTPSEAPLDIARWWLAFDDRQLNGLIDLALVRASDIKIARDRLAAARAERARAVRQYDPQGGITGSGQWQNQHQVSGDVYLPNLPINVPAVPLGSGSSMNLGFAVSWEADVFGRRGATAVVAGAETDAARYELMAARAAVVANVADALFRARYQMVELGRAQDRLKADQSELAAMDDRIAAGMAPVVDRTGPVLQANLTAARVAAARGNLAETKREILLLIGEGTASLDSLVVTPVLRDPPAVPTSAPADLLARRPDVGEARADLVKALGQQTLARLDLFPHFSIGPGVSLAGQSRPGEAFTTSIWSLALQATMPVLDRGRLLAEKHASDARLTGAIDSFEKTVQTAFGETDSVLVQLQADTARLDLFARSARAAGEQVAALREAVDAGMVDPGQLRVALRQQDGAQGDADFARLQALRRTIQAFKALGGGWDPADTGMAAKAARPDKHDG
jgi:outer membrane protein TolC